MKELSTHVNYEPAFTYRQLFIKLAFEYIQRDLQYNKDFEMLYEYIKTFEKELTCIKLKFIDKSSLKSNHYWLMALIPKLKSPNNLMLY